MAKDRDIKQMIKRVNATMGRLEKFLDNVKINAEDTAEVEKDRVSYKEGLVDGICMTSWVDARGTDWVGEKNENGEGRLLSEVLEEIGSVFGFDGKEQLERVKTAEMIEDANREAKAVIGTVENVEARDGDTKVTDMKGEDVEVKDGGR